MAVLRVLEQMKYLDRISLVPIVVAFVISIAGSFLTREMIVKEYTYHRQDYLYHADSHMLLDEVHQEYKCCGATGYHEWITDKFQFPPSCCNSTKP